MIARMKRRTWIWGVPALLYVGFTLWYTNLGGALRPEEIADFVARLEAQGESAEQIESLRRFMETDTGRQFLMVNLVDLAERPPDVAGVAPGASSQQLMSHFFDGLIPGFVKRACHPLLWGGAVHGALDVFGIEGGAEWESSGLVRYRSRRAMMQVVLPLLARHELKRAALDKHIAFPIEMRLYFGDPRLLLGLGLLAGAALLDLATLRSRPA